MWRPENWERIIDKAVLTEAINIMDGGQVELAAGRLFEAGADAMLEALRADGFHLITGTILQVAGQKIKATKNQTLVLIPDEEG